VLLLPLVKRTIILTIYYRSGVFVGIVCFVLGAGDGWGVDITYCKSRVGKQRDEANVKYYVAQL